MTSRDRHGGCFCGAIRYRLAAPPVGSMVCHCRTCRRLTGAPAVGWLTVAAESFAITRGVPAELRSSAPVLRWFCRACGTHIGYVHDDDPGYVEVSTCSLDDPEPFPPTHHSWLRDGVQWAAPQDGLPRFAGSRYASD